MNYVKSEASWLDELPASLLLDVWKHGRDAGEEYASSLEIDSDEEIGENNQDIEETTQLNQLTLDDLIGLALECEENARQFSPFEFFAHDLHASYEVEEWLPELLFDIYETAIADSARIALTHGHFHTNEQLNTILELWTRREIDIDNDIQIRNCSTMATIPFGDFVNAFVWHDIGYHDVGPTLPVGAYVGATFEGIFIGIEQDGHAHT